MKSTFVKKGNKTTFTAVNLTLKDGQYFVDFDGKKTGTSAILTNLLGNSGLLICDTNEINYEIGDKVKVLKI